MGVAAVLLLAGPPGHAQADNAAAEAALATKFAPLLMFDRAAKDYGYPMSAQEYYDHMPVMKKPTLQTLNDPNTQPFENTDLKKAQSGAVPTYYMFKEVEDGGHKQVRINYWSFYGFQHPCNKTGISDSGAHNGDWEHIMVILKEDRSDIAAVVFYQHGGQYTRIAASRDALCTPSGTGRCSKHGFERNDGTHPVVYVAKFAHGSYHEKANGVEGVGSCAYWGDFRNPDGSNDSMESWRRLIDLAGNSESWLTADRQGGFSWGPDGVNTHPTTDSVPSAGMDSCKGPATYDTLNQKEGNGCYQSECLAGDDEASSDCLKECEHGYTNTGLTCTKFKDKILPEHVYGRMNSGRHYGYKYKIPVRDVGLSKRRHDGSDWSLP
jgi:hypothetical protein